ncbi:MAG: hypothetical protein F6K08_03055 [Okeania sp. SIO1H6]|nr:hypothetical protein [Okeania sp. SIO1H6]
MLRKNELPLQESGDGVEVRNSDIPIDYLSMKPNKSLLVLGDSGGSKLVMLG